MGLFQQKKKKKKKNSEYRFSAYVTQHRKVDLLSRTEKRYLSLAVVNLHSHLSIIYVYSKIIACNLLQDTPFEPYMKGLQSVGDMLVLINGCINVNTVLLNREITIFWAQRRKNYRLYIKKMHQTKIVQN